MTKARDGATGSHPSRDNTKWTAGNSSARKLTSIIGALAVICLLIAIFTAPGGSTDNPDGEDFSTGDHHLNVVAYAVPKVGFDRVIPAFRATEAGHSVGFAESYGASGDQSRKVVRHVPTDVVNFSVEPDITRLVKAGVVDENWRNDIPGDASHKAVPFGSVVTFVTRKGNPKGIKTWDDLLRPGLEVISPNPASSGSAKWNILAPYAYWFFQKLDSDAKALGMRGNNLGGSSSGTPHATQDVAQGAEQYSARSDAQRPLQDTAQPIARDTTETNPHDPNHADYVAAHEYATAKVKQLVHNAFKIRPKSGREATSAFEQGQGDVLLSYENEAIMLDKMSGGRYDYLNPDVTFRIENPVAVINDSKNLEQAEAFRNFLFTPEAARLWAEEGFRPAVDLFAENRFGASHATPSSSLTDPHTTYGDATVRTSSASAQAPAGAEHSVIDSLPREARERFRPVETIHTIDQLADACAQLAKQSPTLAQHHKLWDPNSGKDTPKKGWAMVDALLFNQAKPGEDSADGVITTIYKEA
ncbi:extracellular solute-binding protein [Corynebacterium anserum]|uniref:extracellular solute-binding protein n=1 Tax=Corynebacterium anserum TaxID=2684406 RepID=UPI001FE9FAA1